jgi:4-hydroxy-3-polyprenylbenzoate decarboxylase
MRKKPVYLALISQLPPSESSKMRHIGRAAASKRLLHENGFDNVIEVHYLECTGSNASLVVKFKDPKPGQGIAALKLIAERFIGKIAIAVDDDIDIHSLEHVLWAIAWRAQPHRDVEIIDTPLLALDPSIAPPEQSRGLTDAANRPRNSGLLIDATMKWPYPPLSMPKKEFMDRALELWKELQFPKLDLKNPWYGYSLGHWTEEEEEEADLAVHGRHYETGEKLRQIRKMMED